MLKQGGKFKSGEGAIWIRMCECILKMSINKKFDPKKKI